MVPRLIWVPDCLIENEFGGKEGAEGKTALGSRLARGDQAGSAKSRAGSTPHFCQRAPSFLTEVPRVWGQEVEIHFPCLVLT